jgi:hypothetical protein
MKNRGPFLMMLLGFLLMTACSHRLRVTNLDEYAPPPLPARQNAVRVGVTSSSDGHIQNSRYTASIVEALRINPNVAEVFHPYTSADQDKVDTLLDVSITPRYSGRTSNFFINWPGFLIFAPALWGYGYTARIDTVVNITRLSDRHSQQVSVPIKYDFRHAEMDRTWTELGWLEVSLIPFIGGFHMTRYDPDATDEFIKYIAPTYGQYVVRKVLEVYAPPDP